MLLTAPKSAGQTPTLDKMYRILSLDGGGIRGIFQAVVLQRLANNLPSKPLYTNFKLISGTSTGSILALAIALDIDINQIVTLYCEEGSKIFPEQSYLTKQETSLAHQGTKLLCTAVARRFI